MRDGHLADPSPSGFAYHRELNPLFQRFCLLAHGFAAPAPRTDSVHCELGFAQGVSINIHAAAQAAQFVGAEAHSTSVASAQALADVAASGARLLDQDLQRLNERSDLPLFDSISLHGLWSGLSRADRSELVRFIDRHLRPGGVLYVHYDTMPGSAAHIPLHKLMSLFNQMGPGTEGGTPGRVRAALQFVKDITDIYPAYPAEAPLLAVLLDELSKANPQEVANKYFNPHWAPTYFADLCQQLQAARLDWACTATPAQTIQVLQAAAEDKQLLACTTHPVPQQQMGDFMANRDARCDIFVRGARRLGSMEQRRHLMDMRFVLLQGVPQVKAALGIAADAEAADAALANWLDYLGQAPLAARSARGLLEAADEQSWIDHMLMMLVLIGAGVAAPAQSEAEAAAVAPRCAALNQHLLEAAISSQDISALASPVLGGGLDGIDRMQQLFLLARTRLGADSQPEHWAVHIMQLMHEQGEYMLDTHGQRLPDEEHAAALAIQAHWFAQDRLPVLQALHIAA